MKQVLLERFAYTPYGTFGRLIVDHFQCYTVERPWANNKVRKSCIPEGKYKLKLGMYNRGGYRAYELLDVPDRSLIKIHVGNTIDDVVGCIATGRELGFLRHKWGVIHSQFAFDAFMTNMSGEDGEIEIYQYKINC